MDPNDNCRTKALPVFHVSNLSVLYVNSHTDAYLYIRIKVLDNKLLKLTRDGRRL